ncbi:hypothetical protein [Nocardia sp. XZ_19_385]|uniref:hypothetical protein n=1 Tax=Nocardia sp. XZ_19_385 TaxID=2769488 RepID=UPI00189034C4|nr:hypothetical protein [Nocardia sp. XZ_19_385]
MGELFPGQKLADEGSGDSNGETDRPRVELDLDAGVIRVSPSRSGAGPEETSAAPE